MAKRGTTETPEVKTAEQAASDTVTEQTTTPTEGAGTTETPEVKQATSGKSDVPRYSKEKLLKSNWYSHRRDILNVILKDDKEYSHGEVDALIGEFLKGKVK
jgi:hypothetical protein